MESAVRYWNYPAIVNTRTILGGLLAVLTLCFLGVIGYSVRDTSAKEGARAPDFRVVTDSGRQITQESFGGRVLVLNFWATWCAPCIQEIPSLDAFQKKFGGSGVVVLAVSVDKNADKYKQFLEHVRVAFATARDPKADVSAEFGTFQYPETYIIKDGRVMRKFAGAEDWSSEDVTRYVQSLL